MTTSGRCMLLWTSISFAVVFFSFSNVEASLAQRPRSEDNMAGCTFEDNSVLLEACGKYHDWLCFPVQPVLFFNNVLEVEKLDGI